MSNIEPSNDSDWEIASKRIRSFGDCIAEIIPETYVDPRLAANHFGLSQDENIYDEVSEEFALKQLSHLLAWSQAYNQKLMKPEEAASTAHLFLDLFRNESPKYYSNSELFGYSTRSWSGATEAAFDSGILVLSNHKTGCIWLEDED